MIKLEKVLTLDNVENLTTLNKGYTDRQVSALAASVSDIMEDVSSSIDALESGKSDNGHTHSNYASSVEMTGSGNAITSISQSGNKITATKGATFLTAHQDISGKADKSYVDSQDTATLNSAKSYTNTQISGHTHSAYENQNAFSNVKIGTTTIAADSTTDTLTLTAGSNITLTPDASGDGVTIAATDTVTTATTTGSGNAVTAVTASGGKLTVTKGATFLTSHQDISGKADKSYVDSQDTATLTSAKSYTDTKISNLINGAPTTLDTLGEIATAMDENQDVVEALEAAVGNKANASDLTSHTGNKSNPHGVTKAQVGLGNVENKSSATIRGELTKENVTTALGYTPPTTNTTYSEATTSAAGLMSASDKTKLDNTNIAYATCGTAAATAAKVATVTGNDNWKLTVGCIVMVKFSSSNSAENVTLNVNNTGAYPIWYNNAEYTSTGTAYTGYANRTITYMWNGTHWVWVSGSYDANTQSNTNSTNTSKKIFLVGAETQGSSKTTYSHDTAYVGTDGCVYSGSKKTMTVDQLLSFTNVSVAATAWASDTTYTDFPYRAAITCSGVTTAHAADVNFELVNAISGNFAPVTLTATNIVYIYAKTKPTSAMTIPYIEARKAVN